MDYDGLLKTQKPLNRCQLRGFWKLMDVTGMIFGGDEGIRTLDLSVANAALSQLSYIPDLFNRLITNLFIPVNS